MKIISKSFLLSSAFSLVLPQTAFASLSSAYASLVDTNQNQAFESKPAPFLKLASVYFLGNNGGTSFSNSGNSGGQEFLLSDLCKTGGYLYEGCPAGYVPGEACPEDSSFVKECIDPETWCRDNGYNVTSCALPKYLTGKCPHSSTLYKSCETDNARACKEAGYSAECEVGKIKEKACPYDSSYGTCVCNPCTGFGYTSAQASAQGYVPGEVCNSCGTMKYKRSEASCDGFKTCDCGGATGAKTCWSGTTKKFDTCKECCDTSKYKYDYSNCTGNNRLAGNSCGGKYDKCEAVCIPSYKYGQFNKDMSKCAAAIKKFKETRNLELTEDLYCGTMIFEIKFQKYEDALHTYTLNGNGHTITFDRPLGEAYQCHPDGDNYPAECGERTLIRAAIYGSELPVQLSGLKFFDIRDVKINYTSADWNNCPGYGSHVLWFNGHSILTNVDIISDAGMRLDQDSDVYGVNNWKIRDNNQDWRKQYNVPANYPRVYGTLNLSLPNDDNIGQQVVVRSGGTLNTYDNGGYINIFGGGKVNMCHRRKDQKNPHIGLPDGWVSEGAIVSSDNLPLNLPVKYDSGLCESDIFSGDFWK